MLHAISLVTGVYNQRFQVPGSRFKVQGIGPGAKVKDNLGTLNPQNLEPLNL